MLGRARIPWQLWIQENALSNDGRSLPSPETIRPRRSSHYRKTPMKPTNLLCHSLVHSLPIVVLAASLGAASAASVIYTDNFNIADTSSLDGSDQTGRHSGTAANDILVRSGGVQMTITSGSLDFKTADPAGRVRFQPTSLPANTLYNFAAGTTGSSIIADGGFRFEFDWTPDNTTNNDGWISLSAGYSSFDATVRVNQAATDFGILFRNTGGVNYFDGGSGFTGTSFDVSGGAFTRHATIDFLFGSFADGSNVTANAYVDSLLVSSHNFTWDGNGGALHLELGNLGSQKSLDNLSITTIPEPATTGLAVFAGCFACFRRRRA
jgi:hypothetical protein